MSTKGKQYELGEIVSKCWKDAEFKRRFVSDPNSVLREHNIELPAGIQLKVVENTDKVVYFTLPPAPTAAGLSDSALEAVAGGRKNVSSVPRSLLTAYQNGIVLYWQ